LIKGHGGNVHDLAEILNCDISDITDMSSNLNPMGPPPGLKEHLTKNFDKILALPEVDAGRICEKFAQKYNLEREQVIAGNGTTQLIYLIPKVLESKKSLIVAPTYSDYADSCKMNGSYYEYYHLKEENRFRLDIEDLKKRIDGFDTIYICNPNNPTGGIVKPEFLKDLANNYPEKHFVMDESYLPFVDDMRKISMTRFKLANVIVLNSMSKIYRIPGLRIGFLIAKAAIIEKFNRYMLPWSVNGLAYCAVEYLMGDSCIDRFEIDSRSFFKDALSSFLDLFENGKSLTFFPTNTYFVVAKTTGFNAGALCEYLKKRKILIRDCSNFNGLTENFVRFSLKERGINMKLYSHINDFLKEI
jgi:threonine-phosphate decarboxylase